jgi:hypothetical protein
MENIAWQKLTILARLEKNPQNFKRYRVFYRPWGGQPRASAKCYSCRVNFVPSKEDTGLKC